MFNFFQGIRLKKISVCFKKRMDYFFNEKEGSSLNWKNLKNKKKKKKKKKTATTHQTNSYSSIA